MLMLLLWCDTIIVLQLSSNFTYKIVVNSCVYLFGRSAVGLSQLGLIIQFRPPNYLYAPALNGGRPYIIDPFA